MAKAKTYTLIIRGVSKEEKNSLKRMAKKSVSFTSVNQVMLGIVGEKTAPEIAEYKKSKQTA